MKTHISLIVILALLVGIVSIAFGAATTTPPAHKGKMAAGKAATPAPAMEPAQPAPEKGMMHKAPKAKATHKAHKAHRAHKAKRSMACGTTKKMHKAHKAKKSTACKPMGKSTRHASKGMKHTAKKSTTMKTAQAPY